MPIETLFANSCTSATCHDSEAPAGALDLSQNIEEQLLRVASGTCDGWVRVVPGSAKQSLLYQKLLPDPPCGAQMPFVGDAFSEAELACVEDWILGLHASCETCGGSVCVDLDTDLDDCGACGNACPSTAVCEAGSCSCSGAMSLCGDTCVDTQSDPSHCGQCDTRCAAGSACSQGQCDCLGTLEACGGACVDTGSDPAHCGACDKACDPSQVCLDGSCSDGCGDLTQCGQACVDTATNAFHCGQCDNACLDGLECRDGACVCPGGGELCNGTCVDTQTSAQHCGGCGVSCASGDTCVDGVCTCGASADLGYAADIEPILTNRCASAGCHEKTMVGRTTTPAQEDLSLADGQGYANLVGVEANQCDDGRLRVDPGSPSTSYIMQKLTNTNLCFGTQMPKTGQSLPQSELDLIAAWICSGAPE